MCCIIEPFKTSVAAEVDYAKEDVEVKAIYDAIKSDDDNTVDLSQKKKDANQDEGSDQNEDSKGLCALRKFIIGRDKVEVSNRLRNFYSRASEVYTEENKTEGSRDRLIHTAALFSKDSSIIELLTKYCPSLITKKRTGGYAGQTALHITIFKQKFIATEILLKAAKSNNLYNKVLSARATGPNFKNNIMMGETVFSVAVLTLEPEMVDLLLRHDAPIEEVNSKGDNVIHTLIKYAAIKPDSIPKIIKMLKYLKKKTLNRYKDQDKTDTLVAKLWFGENENLETPLKLSVSRGLVDVFNALMKMKSIFYFPCKIDGTFDLRFYDITEIDHINQLEYTKNKLEKTPISSSCCPSCSFSCYSCCPRCTSCCTCCRCYCCSSCFFVKKRISITEKLCDLKWETALPFIDDYDVPIIKAVLSKRYNNKSLKFVYMLYAFNHLIMLLLFTISIFYRKYVANTKCSNSCRNEYNVSQVVPWILMVYGLAMIALEFVRCLGLKKIDLVFKPYKKSQGKGEFLKEIGRRLIMRYHQNDLYRIGQLVFAVCLVVDCFMFNVQKEDKNDLTVTALFSGVWFTFFFFKGLDKFSIYTVMFQKVIMGDMFRFGIWIVIEFTAFCFAMYIVLSDNINEVEEFSTFTNTTLTMFSYMLGLKDLSFLDQVDDTSQHLVAIIYVLCIIVTYILLINSLIAMMSKNAEDTFKHRKSMILLQKFSVVLFLDAIFLIFCLHKPINERLSSGTISNSRKDNPKKDRFYLAIKTENSGKFKRQNKDGSSLRNLTLRDFKNNLLQTKQTISKERKKMFDILKDLPIKAQTPHTPSFEGGEDSQSKTEYVIDIRSEPRIPDDSDPVLDISNQF
ncbi:transient receptor potential cation channel subfamily V member 5 [Biomphalaria glabrata]|nr:transient receptor potential cation channel subfamily V member 5 [Biomphalaria glabrata]